MGTDLLWHYRLGHLSLAGMKDLKQHKAVDGWEHIIIPKHQHVCDGCQLGKAHRQPFTNEPPVVKECMDGASGDLQGPIVPKVNIGFHCMPKKYPSFITEWVSRKLWVRILNKKSEADTHVIDWCRQAQTETGKTLKHFHSDDGGEYRTNKLLTFFKQQGTRVTKTMRNTPQHNGIVERMNRTIMDMVRAMLYHAKAPGWMWEDALHHAVYIRNRCTTSGNKEHKTPEEVWSGHKPSLKHIHVFGCNAYVHVQDDRRTKLDAKARQCVYVGYDPVKQVYKLYDIVKQAYVSSRDVTFDEYRFTFAAAISQSTSPYSTAVKLPNADISGINIGDDPVPTNNNQIPNMEIKYDNINDVDHPTHVHDNKEQQQEQEQDQPVNVWINPADDIEEEEFNIPQEWQQEQQQQQHHDAQAEQRLRLAIQQQQKREQLQAQAPQGQRVSIPRQAKNNPKLNMNDPRLYGFNMAMSVSDMNEPQSFTEAMSRSDASSWKRAADEEMKALCDNNTWSLVKLPPGRHAMDCKWVFKLKLNKDGGIERYKARLVAKGFTQQEGIDYHDTFAAVVKYKSIRIVLALVTCMNYELDQMDVHTAFLNAPIKEEVYMKQAPGYETGGADMVCRLNKTLYGTKQAPHEWNEVFNALTLLVGFIRCKSDTCVYVKTSRSGRVMIICIFVDDLLIAYHIQDKHEWENIKKQFMNKFKMKDMGACEWILGMQVVRDRTQHTLHLNQHQYLENVLKQFNMHQSTSASTPEQVMRSNKDEHEESQTQLVNIKLYQSIIGALLYASQSTRPDISHAVGMLSRHLSNPNSMHLLAAKRILRYIRGTSNMGLLYKGNRNTNMSNKYHSQYVHVEAYSDADWAGDVADRKSTTGFVIMINGNVVSWGVKKQPTIALSTAEAEYMAISLTVQEALWIKQLLKEMKFGIYNTSTTTSSDMIQQLQFIPQHAITLWCDNQAAISISKNDVHHHRTKHIDIRHHFVRDAVASQHVAITWIPSEKQVADILTKALGPIPFTRLRNEIVSPIPTQERKSKQQQKKEM